MSRTGLQPRRRPSKRFHLSLVDERCCHMIEAYKRPLAGGIVQDGNGRASMSVSLRSRWIWTRKIANGRWAGPRTREYV